MTIGTRRASCLTHAAAIGIAAMIAVGAAGPCRAAASSDANGPATGRQTELVNRPGCWTGGGYELRVSCNTTGEQE